LQEAGDAFVFGVSLAAIALMRSIREGVLEGRYRWWENDLSELIGNCHGLPKDAPKRDQQDLQRSRSLANAIPHLHTAGRPPPLGLAEQRTNRLARINEGDDAEFVRLRTHLFLGRSFEFERELVSHFRVLRALIEGAPTWLGR